MLPIELLSYPQWVCWRASPTPEGKLTKLPYSPRTGKLASVTDPQSWSTFEIARDVALNGAGYSGVGFVLTERDPYCFIDLDDPGSDAEMIERYRAISEAMDSYSEVSPSGRGLHIIVKASVPQGRRRKGVEIYSAARYMTMTGNTYQNKPIQERSYLTLQLWKELGEFDVENNIDPTSEEQKYEDALIYKMAVEAENGEKFLSLWNGDFIKHYQSQSEADFALINILSFYSRNISQITRMFLMSALGQREKAKRRPDYVKNMVRRSFDNTVPDIPIEAIKLSVVNKLMQKTAEEDRKAMNPFAGPLFANVIDTAYDWTCPPGLMGDLASFFYQAAPRPVKEIALAAAIGLLAGVCGRGYNISGTGLNQYVLILAKTGVGKEAAASGIDRLMQAVKPVVPAALDFIGPSEIASGQALAKHLSKYPCFVSIVGEFGLALQVMCSLHANAPQVTLRKTLLSLYNKSGATDVLRGSIYSDKDKDAPAVMSPAFSLLGESTPESFYSSMDETMIAQGLLPRFTCIEYEGMRPKLNMAHVNAQPSSDLLTRFAELTANCLLLAQHQRVVTVTMDSEATDYSDSINVEYDGRINTSEIEVARQLWNRAHIKTLKLASLIAIGINMYQPIIKLEHIKWASLLIDRDIENVLNKFRAGQIGRVDGEINQMSDIVACIKEYIQSPYEKLKQFAPDQMMHADRVLQWSYMHRRLAQKSAFRVDRMGATNALKRCVEAMLNDGVIRELRSPEVYTRYRRSAKCYLIVDAEKFT